MMNVMVLGGYGNFGARISRALSDDDRIQLLVAGRDAQQAEAFAAALLGRAKGV
jgi:saccharopine dehydrogenase-like NADP-dependent oxidoreductase